MNFPQGRVPDKMIANRCPFCKKYQKSPSDYRKHIAICEKKPKLEEEPKLES